MQNIQDTFETSRGSFISAFSICMTVHLRIKKPRIELKASISNERQTHTFIYIYIYIYI